MYSLNKPTGIERKIKINSDGTINYPNGKIGHLNWHGGVNNSQSIKCDNNTNQEYSYLLTGAANVNYTLPGMILKWLMVKEDGTVIANSYYSCLNKYTAVEIVPD